jgi:hypothetical protein
MQRKDRATKFSLFGVISLIVLAGISGLLKKGLDTQKSVVNHGARGKAKNRRLIKHFFAPADVKDHVSTHAAVLALILATLSAYVIYSIGKTDEIRMKIFQEAEKINSLDFVIDFDVLEDRSIYDTTDPERRTYLLIRLDDIVKGKVVIDSPGMKPIGFAREPELRGEEVIRTMRSVSQHYPFRKPLRAQVTPVGTREIVYEPLRFTDTEKTGKWAADLAEVANRFNYIVYSSGPMLQAQIDAFNEKLRSQHAARFQMVSPEDVQRIMLDFDQRSPKAEAQIFINNMKRAGSIAEATRMQYEQLAAHQARGSRTNRLIRWGFILASIAFVCAVMLPMIFGRVPRLLAAYVPTAFYLFTLIVVGYYIFQL